jgi:hypothetical protein
VQERAASLIKYCAHRVDHEKARVACEQSLTRRALQHGVDARYGTRVHAAEIADVFRVAKVGYPVLEFERV